MNPGRAMGAKHIHGISDDDVADAPAFPELVGDLLSAIDGSVLAAHNYHFYRGVLDAEFSRTGLTLPPVPSLCTLILSQRLQPGTAGRRLAALCGRAGIEIGDRRHALDDARATAKLLAQQIELATEQGIRSLEALGCQPSAFPELPEAAASGRVQPRPPPHPLGAKSSSFLARAIVAMDKRTNFEPHLAAYVELVDRVIVAGNLGPESTSALLAQSERIGLPDAVLTATNRSYSEGLRLSAAEMHANETEEIDVERAVQFLIAISD